jgi:ADP-heptose:LPS heptosyltransferase
MALFSGAPVRVAECVRGRRAFYTRTVAVEHAGKHLVEQKMQIVGALTGDVPIPDAEVFLRDGEREEAQGRLRRESGGCEGPFVGLFPGAGWEHREWPADRFARLGDLLAERGFRAVVLGGPRDVAACRRVAERMSSRPVVLAGVARLRDTIALIDRMALFVSNDTGPMHIAAGLGRPTIGLFGPGDIVKYRPWGANAHVISARLPCSPCPQWRETCRLHGFRPGECMERISVEEVYGKAVEILDATLHATKAAGEDR